MANRKKRRKDARSGQRPINNGANVFGESGKPTAEQIQKGLAQKQIIDRLKKLIAASAAPPEGVLGFLDRLQIPWQTSTPITTDELDILPDEQIIVIKASDLLNGEKLNQTQGSLFKRLFGESWTPPAQFTDESSLHHSDIPAGVTVTEPSEHVVREDESE